MVGTIAHKVRIILLAISLLPIIITSLAATEIEGTGILKSFVPVYVAGNENGSSNQSVSLDIEYQWRIWSLFGEPVQVAKIRWSFAGSNLPSPPGSTEKLPSLNSIPSEVLREVNLFDVKLSVNNGNDFYTTITGSNPNAYFIIDAGAINRAGANWSFNVAGSPDWGEVLFAQRTSSVPINLFEDFMALPAGEAKQVFKKSLVSNQERVVELVDAKIDLSPVWNWWRNKQYKSQLFDAHKVAAVESAKLIQHYKKIHPTPILKRIEQAKIIKLEGEIDRALELIKNASNSLKLIWPDNTRNLNEIVTENYGSVPVEVLFEIEVSRLKQELEFTITSLDNRDIENFGLKINQNHKKVLNKKVALPNLENIKTASCYYVYHGICNHKENGDRNEFSYIFESNSIISKFNYSIGCIPNNIMKGFGSVNMESLAQQQCNSSISYAEIFTYHNVNNPHLSDQDIEKDVKQKNELLHDNCLNTLTGNGRCVHSTTFYKVDEGIFRWKPELADELEIISD